ncbi:hypothetical protein G6514_001950 [Epicoccum nigrum]|nr:hypothetical protein G6514_001950 [Epicoccum nigrum]
MPIAADDMEPLPAQTIEDEQTQVEHTEEPLQKSGVANAGEKAVMAKARYQEGQLVHMAVIQGGARVKGVFRINKLLYNHAGWVEYQLKEDLTGQLYRHGAAVREKDLKPQ